MTIHRIWLSPAVQNVLQVPEKRACVIEHLRDGYNQDY